MPIISYRSDLKEKAKYLRSHMTPAEVYLWKYLKSHPLGCDFHRQKPIGAYIVDFYCPELSLVIEIDGGTHFLKSDRDQKREKELVSLGLSVLHFTELETMRSINVVTTAIEQTILSLKKRQKRS
ncbi:MAG: endonuclease domain-containing protein [Candidatus Roizmanbacteria bacterium]